ncbi:MAG: lysylphosphatidylglycerol synthase transmembrane domain-containing protein [candidate division Zixibacteria bacterium]|nr:lysylphosphatidylglycerol synthase transmembrane domain-containing protein [candidate division Zixibacteria bacterium]
MTPGTKKLLWRITQVVLIGLIFYFLGRQLVDNWSKVTAYQWQINYPLLIAGTCLCVFTFFIMSSVWRLIILSLGKRIGRAKAFKISYIANLGRYIPGKIWQMFGMIMLAKKEGITEEEAVTSFGLTQLFAVPSGLLCGVVFLLLSPGGFSDYAKIPYMSAGLKIVGAAILLVSILTVLYPQRMEALLNRIFVLFKRKVIRLKINKSLAAAIYGGYFLAWSLYGLSFWIFVKGVTVETAPVFPVIGLFIIAYQIGYLAVFAPGGMGPREAVMTLLLAPFFGPAVAAALSLASRLWLIIVEAIAALIALKIK